MIQIERPWLSRLGLTVGLGLVSLALAAPSQLLAAPAVKKKPAVVQKKGKVASQKAASKRVAAKRVKTNVAAVKTRPGKGKRAAVLAARSAAVAGGGLAAASAAGALDRKSDLHQASDAPPKLSANAVFVMDQNSREVLVSKNEQAVLPIASLTKLMTGLVVSEAHLPMDGMITITQDDVDTEKGSRSRLKVGTTLTRGELMHLSLMSSENRAAHALGRTYPGGMSAFVSAMNAKAKLLGMTTTRYVEPTGLSSRNQSSAHDLATLVAEAYKEPVLRELSTSPGREIEVGRRVLQYNNTNRLVKSPQWDIGLQKTGYISEAGQCLVMQAQIAGRKLILVFLDSAGKLSRIADAERVRRWLETAPRSTAIHTAAAGRQG